MLAVIADAERAPLVAQYVTEKTGVVFQPGMFVAFALVASNGEFAGAVIVSNYRRTDCELSLAAETPLAWRPHVCRAVFEYVFNTLGCVRCTVITTKKNRTARNFIERFGFELEGNLRRGYDGRRDALIYGLLAADCRYLAGGHDGEKVRSDCADAARSRGGRERAGGGEQGSGDCDGEPQQDRPDDATGRNLVPADRDE